jgi:hypothetical protein
MKANNRTRRNILALAGLLPGALLGLPGQVKAGKQRIRPFLLKLEMENMATMKPARHPSITCKQNSDGMSLFYKNGNPEPLFALNRTGTTVWNACSGDRTVNDIAAALSQDYEVSRDQAFIEVFQVIRNMQHRGALRFNK